MSPTIPFSSPSSLSHRFSHDNLHIRLEGPLEMPQAEELVRFLQNHQESCQRIFLDVRGITHVQPDAAENIRTFLQQGGIAGERVHFKGENGFLMAATGNRILTVPASKKEHACKGNCPNCRCRREKSAA